MSSSSSGMGKCNISKPSFNLGYKIDYNFLAKYKYGNRNKWGMKIMHWNAGGRFLQHKIAEIEVVIDKFKPHVFGISEACFKLNHRLDDIKIEGYEVYFAKTLENVALNVSRVAVYIHNDVFKKKLRTDLMTDEFSSIWLEIDG